MPSTRSGETWSRRTVSRNPSGSTTSISSPTRARSERARWRASPPTITARPPSRLAKNDGKLPRLHAEGFVDRDLSAALQDRAPLRHLGRLVQRGRFDDRVAGGPLSDRAFAHRAASLDFVHRPYKRLPHAGD